MEGRILEGSFSDEKKERNEKIVKIRKFYILLLYPVKDL
jgi:hypothetical protein